MDERRWMKMQDMSIHESGIFLPNKPILALCSKNNPRNINYMTAVIFFVMPFDLE